MQAFGYTTETMQFMLLPLVNELRDPVGSMGNDSALAVLSDKPRMVYDYFKQLFAQVTNPPIDSIREEIIMSLECYIGPEANLLDVRAETLQRSLSCFVCPDREHQPQCRLQLPMQRAKGLGRRVGEQPRVIDRDEERGALLRRHTDLTDELLLRRSDDRQASTRPNPAVELIRGE